MQKTMEDGFMRAAKSYPHPMRMQEDRNCAASILSPLLRGGEVYNTSVLADSFCSGTTRCSC